MTASVEEHPVVRAGRREWLGLTILVLPILVLSVDLSVLYLALPHLAADLGATGTQQLWTLDIYGFLVAGFLITMGTLGDRIGRRRLLMIGGVAFGAASVIAAYSTSPEMLIGARALLGIAGATVAPSTLALISNMFKDPKQRAAAVAVWSACFMGGAVFGPLIGGTMLSWFWWGSVFLLAVPVMLLLVVAGPMLLPEYRNPDAGRVDLTSVAMSLAAIIPFIFGVKELARQGSEPGPLAALVIGLIFGVLFVLRQQRLRDPLLDLGLFKISVLRTALLLTLFGSTVQGGTMLLVAQYLQLVGGLSPLRTGLLLGPPALGMVITIMVSSGLVRTIRPAYLMGAGMLTSALGFILLTQVESTGSLVLTTVGVALSMAGLGPVVALGYNMILGSAPPEKAGSASATVETSGQFGTAFGIATIGSIAVAVYRSRIDIPDETPPAAAEAANEGIAGAVAAAANLPADIGNALFDSAAAAYTSGLHLAAVVAAVMFALLSLLAIFGLRQVPPSAQEQPQSAPVGESNAATTTGSDGSADGVEPAGGVEPDGGATAEPATRG